MTSVAAPSSPAALLTQWAAHFRAKSAHELAALYAPDAQLWATVSTQACTGREAIRRFFEEVAAEHVSMDVAPRLADCIEAGNIALLIGSYGMHLVPKSGAPEVLAARFTMALVARDRAWSIAQHHSSVMPE